MVLCRYTTHTRRSTFVPRNEDDGEVDHGENFEGVLLDVPLKHKRVVHIDFGELRHCADYFAAHRWAVLAHESYDCKAPSKDLNVQKMHGL